MYQWHGGYKSSGLSLDVYNGALTHGPMTLSSCTSTRSHARMPKSEALWRLYSTRLTSSRWGVSDMQGNLLITWQFHPSYPSASLFSAEVLDDVVSEKDIMQIRSGLFEPNLKKIMSSLPEWRTERPHGPKAVLSTHDTAALTSDLRPCHQTKMS